MQIKCYNCFQDYDSTEEVCPHCGHDPRTEKREANHLPKGTLLNNRYIVGVVCGFGGFGIIYKVWDTQLEIIVAIKEYFPNGSVNRVPGTTPLVLFKGSRLREFQFGLTRFIEEARTTAKYGSHKNIVNVFDYFEENHTAYIVMEYLDGISLDKYLQQFETVEGAGRLDIDTALDITLSVCNALKALHADGIIHRDISPDNIYMLLNGSYKLYDFGAARFSADENRMLTVILKPGYAPPEQYDKVNPQGPWTDIYALGATLYKMVTGVKPVESLNRKVQESRNAPDSFKELEELAEPMTLNPEIPQYLNDAIMKAMALERHLRFQTVEEFEAVLKQEKPVEAPWVTVRKRKRRRFTGIAAAIAVLMAGSGVIGWRVYQDMTVNRLAAAEIEVWYNEENSTFPGVLEEIRKEFCGEREDLVITMKPVPAAEYAETLQQAADAGELPALFQSDGIDLQGYDILPLQPSLRMLELDQYYFLETSQAAVEQAGKLPLGWNAPVFYLNTTRVAYDGDSIGSLSDVLGEGGTAAVSIAQQEQFNTLFPDANYTQAVPEQFYGGQADLLFSDTGIFYKVQETLPAQFRMLPPENTQISFTAENCWSLGNRRSADEEKLARRFLEFMLSDYAQDFYYIREKTPALPISRSAADEFLQVYSEFDSVYSEASQQPLILD